MSDNRNAMLDILAETNKLMHQRRVEGLIRSRNGPLSATTALVPFGGADGSTSASGLLTPYQPTERVRSINYIGARDNRSDFFDSWSRKIESFVHDSTQTTLDLPAELDSNDRRVLHQLADKFNLAHMSVGKGQERHLVLKKDTLYYRAATKVIDHDAIDALKNKKEAMHGSRYHLRRAHKEGGGGELAHGGGEGEDGLTTISDMARDRATVQKTLSALDRATNQFAYATDQIQPAQLTPATSEASKYLTRGVGSNTDSNTHAGKETAADVPNVWAAAMQQQKKTGGDHPPAFTPASSGATSSGHDSQQTARQQTSHTLKDVITYEEQCTSCSTSTLLDYDVSQWTCLGHCSVCQREAVFRLVERRRRVVVAIEQPTAPVSAAEDAIGSKRPRDDMAAADVPTTTEAKFERPQQQRIIEEIVKEDDNADQQTLNEKGNESSSRNTADTTTMRTPFAEEVCELDDAGEDEEIIPLEVSDLVSMLECNDHSAAFISWVRSFAQTTLMGVPEAIGSRVLLVMELGDVPSRGPSVGVGREGPKTGWSAAPPSRRLFCTVKSDAVAVATLLDDVWRNVFHSSDDIIIGLCNQSVAGVGVEVVVHGPASVEGRAAAEAIKERVGGSRFAFSSSLKHVI